MTGISIADLSRNRRTFEFMTDYGPLKVTYRPYAMTPAREAEISRLAADARDEDDNPDVQQTEQGLTKVIAQFLEVVEAWGLVGPLHTRPDGSGDLVVPEGESVPISTEILRYVPSFFLVQILNAVGRDARPKRTRQDS